MMNVLSNGDMTKWRTILNIEADTVLLQVLYLKTRNLIDYEHHRNKLKKHGT